jgi:hypothetical protein
MNLSDRELKFLASIVDTYVELTDDRLAYWYGNINSQEFTDILKQRHEAFLLSCKLKELSRQPARFTIAIQIPDGVIDRN